MAKQYFDVSRIILDETGRTALGEEQLKALEKSHHSGAGWLDDLIDWWNTNNGRCVNVACSEESNNASCRNGLDCDISSNAGDCYNDHCDGTENPSTCMNVTTCVGTAP